MGKVKQDEERVISRRIRFVFIFTTIVLSMLTVLLLFEIILRIQTYWDDRKNFEAFQKIGQVNIPLDYHGKIAWFHCIRMSKNPRIIYELIPNLSVKLMAHRFSTNPEGFRSPLYSTGKDNNTFRIIGIGDSTMFGWGVHDDETYLAFLYERLNNEIPGILWQVINTAVPGYNTVMEVETLKEKTLKHKPDLVIVGFSGNDLSLPNFIRAKRNYFTLKESYLIEALGLRMKKVLQKENIPGSLVRAPRDDSGERPESDPKRVPGEYRDMVGLDAYLKAMRELKSLSVKHGFSILLFSIWKPPKYVKDITSVLDIPVINTSQSIREYMRQNKITKYKGPVMAISKKDGHPSAITHKICMDVLFDYIKSNVLSNNPR